MLCIPTSKRKWSKIDKKKRSTIINKTGLQPVSRPVELVHYFGGWVEGPSKQTDRQD